MRLWLLLIGASFAARRPRWEPRPSVVADYNIAVEALNALAFAPAEEVLRAVIAADPGCGLCRQTLAIALVRQDRPDEALQLLAPLAEAHPGRADVFTLSTIAALADQQPALARSSAERAVALQPADLGAQKGLLSALLASSELDAAAAAADAAVPHLSQPASACLRAEVALATLALDDVRPLLASCAELGDAELVGELALKLARAEGDLPAVLRLAREQRLEPLLGKAAAAEHLQAGELAEAMRLLDAELSRRPDDPDALLLRAWCWQALEQPEQAEEDLVRLLSLPAPIYADERGRLFSLHSRAALRRQALALYVTLLVDSDRAAEARRRLEAERPTLGEGPELAAAEVTLLLAAGEVDAAAAAWTEATTRWARSEPLATAAIRLDGEQPLSADGAAWLLAAADPGYTLQLATQRYHDGRYRDCQETLAPLMAHSEPEIRRLSLRLAHRAAVAAEDLPQATTHRTALTAAGGQPTVEAALRHAWLLGEAGEDEDALALLAATTPESEATLTQHRSLSIWLLAEQGRLDEATALSEAGAVEPAQLANLAVALYAAGQHRKGRALMASACTEMDGEQARKCRAALSRMP